MSGLQSLDRASSRRCRSPTHPPAFRGCSTARRSLARQHSREHIVRYGRLPSLGERPVIWPRADRARGSFGSSRSRRGELSHCPQAGRCGRPARPGHRRWERHRRRTGQLEGQGPPGEISTPCPRRRCRCRACCWRRRGDHRVPPCCPRACRAGDTRAPQGTRSTLSGCGLSMPLSGSSPARPSAVVHWLERGIPTPTRTPPRLAERGLRGRPTLVQNVETLAHLALITRYGASWYREVGTDAEPGSMLVTLLGAVHRPGVYEVAIGTRLSDVLGEGGSVARQTSSAVARGLFR